MKTLASQFIIIVNFPAVLGLVIIAIHSVKEKQKSNVHLILLGNITDFSHIGSWPPGQDSQFMNMPRLISHFIWLTILLQQSK